MSNNSPMYKYALMDEKAEIESIMTAATTGAAREAPEKTIKDDMLDRAQADSGLTSVIETFGSDGNVSIEAQLAQVTAYVTNRQEDQRVRRDAKILKQGHKRLMLGCMQTLFVRKINIESLLQ